MKVPAFETTEQNDNSPVLIVDKIGVIGEALANDLSNDYLVVLLSAKDLKKKNKKIIYIPFKRSIPQAPDNYYQKIFIVDDGNSVTRESAVSFIDKARKTNAKLYFIGSIRNVDLESADEIVSYSGAKVLIFGDLFDKNIFFDKDVSITRFILQARKLGKIDVPGNGLSLSYPITFNDTIKLIIKASYLEIPQKIILLFYPHPITDISLANTFQKINPEIKVDFVKEREEKNIYIPKEAQHAIKKYDLREKLKELELEDKENREVNILNKEKTPRNKFVKPVLFFLLACLFLILLPLLTTASYSFLGKHQLESAKNLAEEGNFDKALKKSENAKTFFEIAGKTGAIFLYQAQIIGKENGAQKLLGQIETAENLSNAVIHLLEGSVGLKNVYSGNSSDPKKEFTDASSSLKSAYSIIQKINAQDQIPDEYKEKFNNILPVVELFSNSSEVLPEVFGFDKEKKYLVLFQNNMELRPGGGFIGSVGLLTVKDARVKDFEILDVYSLDGQLKAHVEPPYPIRRHIPIVHLYLRDSNFSPDFVTNAITASDIYKLETKKEIDGVIGIDLHFAKNIISALGPISVTDYDKEINEDNLYFVTQEEAEKDFFPGSTRKKDFLSALAKSVELNLKSRENIPFFLLTEKMGKSLLEKHILFAFKDQGAQSVFTANGWSGTLIDNRKLEDRVINDFFGISEANLGVNKVNYFISRSISKKVIIEKNGSVSSVATIAFKNSSKKGSMTGRDYKNYLRLILPEGSRVNEIFIDNKKTEIVPAETDYLIYERQGYKAPSELEVDRKDEMGKSIFGFLINVPQESIKTIKVVYSIPFSVSVDEKLTTYSLKIYKQPGIDSYPFDLTFSAPGYKILPAISFDEEIIKDEEVKFIISQK